ncbi:MAG: hypothetical protein IJX91_05540 [Clostridia bacterium]|nr:hypothetical protein [Clostridia bacterium]
MRKSFIAAIFCIAFSCFCACGPQVSFGTDTAENTDTESVTEESSENIEESSDTEDEEESKEYNYECRLTFFVNPRLDGEASEGTDEESQYAVYGAYGNHVMNTMVKLLSSDIFAEEVASGIETEVDLKSFKSFIAYSYDTYYADDGTALARSFIYVRVSVPEEEGIEFTEKLVGALQAKVPEFIEKNMPVPTGYDGTECTLTKSAEIVKKEK